MNKRGDFFITIIGVMACLLLASAITAAFIKYSDVPVYGVLPAHIIKGEKILDVAQLQFDTITRSVNKFDVSISKKVHCEDIVRAQGENSELRITILPAITQTQELCSSELLLQIEKGLEQYLKLQTQDSRINSLDFKFSTYEYFSKIHTVQKNQAIVTVGLREPIEIFYLGQDSAAGKVSESRWTNIPKEKYIDYQTFVSQRNTRYAVYLKRDIHYNVTLSEKLSTKIYIIKNMQTWNQQMLTYPDMNALLNHEKSIADFRAYIQEVNPELFDLGIIIEDWDTHLVAYFPDHNLGFAYPLAPKNE